ncbi:MAG: isoprenylcysteine carboxylmethyltransferase family protein [Candidatus Aminicenantes bacterium]|nr:MAG: isoprenylcysteine carboxylmethyltransferase family protein [Candidatus Aminicenantes bacterium]
MEKAKTPSKSKIIIQTIFTSLFCLAAIFIPAGTLKWTEAWVFIILYAAGVTAAIFWMKKKAPDLLKERMKRKKDIKSWDKIFRAFYLFFLLVILILPGLDAVRFQWSNVPLILKAIAFIGYIPGSAIAFWAMRENAFLSDVVRIQEDRGHTVCTTGPYKYVRHPMYVGVILIMLCFPFSLGSLYTLIPAVIIMILFFIRTALEDKTLREELPCYKEYSQKVRYRLIPGIW